MLFVHHIKGFYALCSFSMSSTTPLPSSGDPFSDDTTLQWQHGTSKPTAFLLTKHTPAPFVPSKKTNANHKSRRNNQAKNAKQSCDVWLQEQSAAVPSQRANLKGTLPRALLMLLVLCPMAGSGRPLFGVDLRQTQAL